MPNLGESHPEMRAWRGKRGLLAVHIEVTALPGERTGGANFKFLPHVPTSLGNTAVLCCRRE